MISLFNNLGTFLQSFVSAKSSSTPRYTTRRFGVYEVIFQSGGWFEVTALYELRKGMPYVARFINDVWGLSPSLVLFAVFGIFWSSIRSTLDLYCANQLLEAVRYI